MEAERERILAIIRDEMTKPLDAFETKPRLYDYRRQVLEDLLDVIAFKSGLTAADVRVPSAQAQA